MKDNCFIVLCWFLPNINTNTYIKDDVSLDIVILKYTHNVFPEEKRRLENIMCPGVPSVFVCGGRGGGVFT